MKIVVASGKGGTGKTTVASSLIHVWHRPVIAVDLDVEEPNLHLFLKPDITHSEKALMEVPRADESLCKHCRACVDLCQFKAVSLLGDILMTFPEMCHGCGGCLAVCPTGALTNDYRELGEIRWHEDDGEVDFLMGRLRVSEAMSPPLMRAVKARLEAINPDRRFDVIIDAPPGVSCPAVNAVMDADMILLVTEPTPFGHFDLKLAHEAFRPLNIPMAVVINRAGIGDRKVYAFCESVNLPVLADIPYDRSIAESYACGQIVAASTPERAGLFRKLARAIVRFSAAPKEELCA